MAFDRHTILVALTNMAVDQLSDKEIIQMCPGDYGSEVSEDHLNFLWDKLYTDYNRLDDIGLYELFLQVERALLGQELDAYLSGESDTEPAEMVDPERTLH